ncbi:MAG: proteasome assembly chaperone family protein [Thermoplasmata archaeon]
MNDIEIVYLSKPKLKNPILIEGLPGVGNVGKLAADHLVDELKAVKFIDVFSSYFPPQVLVGDDGVVKLVRQEIYYVKKKSPNHDLIILAGDYQGMSPEGQYVLSDRCLDVLEGYNIRRMYTLGGYGVGRMVEKPRVLGAATDTKLVEEMKKYGIVFPKGEPGSGIIGASGLLLGLGKLRDIPGVCIMGETSGYFADPKSAEAVLEILTKILSIKINYTKLEKKAAQIDKITAQLKEMESPTSSPSPDSRSDDLRYIG